MNKDFGSISFKIKKVKFKCENEKYPESYNKFFLEKDYLLVGIPNIGYGFGIILLNKKYETEQEIVKECLKKYYGRKDIVLLEDLEILN